MNRGAMCFCERKTPGRCLVLWRVWYLRGRVTLQLAPRLPQKIPIGALETWPWSWSLGLALAGDVQKPQALSTMNATTAI